MFNYLVAKQSIFISLSGLTITVAYQNLKAWKPFSPTGSVSSILFGSLCLNSILPLPIKETVEIASLQGTSI